MDNATATLESPPERPARFRLRRSWYAPAIAVLGAAIVRLFGWRGPDIPAQVYRVALFRTHGFVLWDNGWYGGHYQLPYSVLFPPLGAVLGLYGAATLSAAAAAWAFGRLVEAHFGRRSTAAGILFALGTAGPVAIGQLPFLAGEAVGLLALLAARRRLPAVAIVLSIACPLFSPVAGAFLMLAWMSWAFASPSGARARLVALTFVTAAPLLVLGALFPSTGPFPFLGIDLVLIIAVCGIGIFWLPKSQRALRNGLILYGLTAIAVFAVPNPIGGNLERLIVSFGPAILVALWTRYHRRALLVLALPLLIWQGSPAIGAIIESNQNQAASVADYYKPLVAQLTKQPAIGRVEIPFTAKHWEAAYVALDVPLARGWERQADMHDNPLFYKQAPLNATTYRRWLYENGVSWVALPDIPLDYSSQAEAKLIEAAPSYLRLAWHDKHWRLFRVLGSPGLTTGSGRLVALDADQFVVVAPHAGSTTIRVRYTPKWNVVSGPGCVVAAHGEWTEVVATGAGRIVVDTTLLPHDNDCKPAATG